MSRRAARDAGLTPGEVTPGAVPGAQPGTTTVTEESTEKTGIAAVFARHPRAWLAGALGLAFVLLGTGAVFAGAAVGSTSSVVAETPEDETPPEDPARGTRSWPSTPPRTSV